MNVSNWQVAEFHPLCASTSIILHHDTATTSSSQLVWSSLKAPLGSSKYTFNTVTNYLSLCVLWPLKCFLFLKDVWVIHVGSCNELKDYGFAELPLARIEMLLFWPSQPRRFTFFAKHPRFVYLYIYTFCCANLQSRALIPIKMTYFSERPVLALLLLSTPLERTPSVTSCLKYRPQSPQQQQMDIHKSSAHVFPVDTRNSHEGKGTAVTPSST